MKQNAMVAAGFAACLLLAGPARSETDKVNFLLDWVIYGRATPYFVALEKGFFQSRNIRSPGSSAATARPPGSSGWLPDRQIFCSRILAASSWRERTKAFAPRWLPSSTAGTATPCTIWKAPASSRRPTSGKRVAGAPGSTVAALFPAFLRANKVDPETVRIISVDPQALNPVLLAKQFDGMLEFNFNNALLVKEGTKMGLKPAYMMYADHNFRFYANGIITTDLMIAAEAGCRAPLRRGNRGRRAIQLRSPRRILARSCASMRRALTRIFVLRSSTWSRISRSPTRPGRTEWLHVKRRCAEYH